MFNCDLTSDEVVLLEETFLNRLVCKKFKYMVYAKIITDTSFINKLVLKKLLKGLTIKSTINTIEANEHKHIFLVMSVNIVKLNGEVELIKLNNIIILFLLFIF